MNFGHLFDQLKKINCLKNLNFFQIMKSHWCQLAFIGFLILGYWLIPQTALLGQYQFWSIVFMISFAASSTCAVRGMKERMASKLKGGASILSVIASLLGLSAVQFCSVNAVMCGSTLGFGALSMILPKFLFRFLHHHAIAILIGATIVQIISLYSMGCLNFVECLRSQDESSSN